MSEILVYFSIKGLLEGDSTRINDLFISVFPSVFNVWSLNFDDSHFSIPHDRMALARLNISSCFLKHMVAGRHQGIYTAVFFGLTFSC